MPHVNPIHPDQAPSELREIFNRSPRLDDPSHPPGPGLFLSQVEVLAHTPGILRGLHEIYRWFSEEGRVPRKYHELAIVAVSNLNRCSYCVSHHTPLALASGATQAQVEAIRDGIWRNEPDLFDEAERAVVTFAEQATLEPWKLVDESFEPLRRHFDDAQIVELAARITLCSFWNKFNDAMGLQLEAGVNEVSLQGVSP